jgi:hypothetical protein
MEEQQSVDLMREGSGNVERLFSARYVGGPNYELRPFTPPGKPFEVVIPVLFDLSYGTIDFKLDGQQYWTNERPEIDEVSGEAHVSVNSVEDGELIEDLYSITWDPVDGVIQWESLDFIGPHQ